MCFKSDKSCERRELSITEHFFRLFLIIIIPIFLLCISIFYYYYSLAEAQFERRIVDHTEVMKKTVDNRLSTLVRLLNDNNLCSQDVGDLKRLQWTLLYTLQIKDASLVFYNQDRQRIFHSGVLGADAISRDHSQDYNNKIDDDIAYSVSDLLADQSGNRYNQVSIPVICYGQQTGTISVNVSPSYWEHSMQTLENIPDIRVSIVDQKKRFIVAALQSHNGIKHSIRTNIDNILQVDLEQISKKHRIMQGAGVDNSPLLLSIYQSDISGWYTIVAIPRPFLYASLTRSFLIITAISVVLFSLLAFLIASFCRKLSKPILQLAHTANEMKRHQEAPCLISSVKEVNEVSALLTEAYQTIEKNYQTLRTSEERYRLATDVFQGAVFEYDGLTDERHYSPRFHTMFGDDVDWHRAVSDRELSRFHPDDREKVRKYVHEIFHSDERDKEIEYRVRARNGEWIWIWDKAAITRDENNHVIRVIGALLDITAHKRAEENLSLVIRELNHRVKNSLAIVQSIAVNTMRSKFPVDEKLRLFEQRIIALAKTHDLITQQNWKGAPLRDVVMLALAPFIQKDEQRFTLSGSDLWIKADRALSLTMALHEMGTNASKYGALSNDEGMVHISWKEINEDINGGTISLIDFEWREEKGPEITQAPIREGFGSRLLKRSFANDSNALVEFFYPKEGIICHLRWTGSNVDSESETYDTDLVP